MIKVLIASKNIDGVELYSSVLENHGMSVQKCYELEPLMFRTDLGEYDVIILGGDLEKSIKTLHIIRMLTYSNIIVISNEENTELAIEAFYAGADEFYVKRGLPELLTARIIALVRRNDVILNRIIESDNFTFDLEKEVCYFKGEKLDITHREFRILFILLKNKYRIVSKEEIYRIVWNKELGEDKSPFWTTMSRLNKKIEKYNNDFSIDSNREGYQLYIRK